MANGAGGATSHTRTPGTPVSPGTSRALSTTSRTSSRRTRSSRVGPGRPSSWVGGYRISSWSERNAMEHADAIIAVSAECGPTCSTPTRRSIPPECTWCTTGSTRTSGTPARRRRRHLGTRRARHLARAADRGLSSDASPDRRDLPTSSPPRTGSIPRSSWCCARARPTRRTGGGDGARGRPPRRGARRSVLWIRDMLPHRPGARNTSAATVFVCPSVYEPLGIVNWRRWRAPRRGRLGRRRHPGGGAGRCHRRLVHYNSYEVEAFEHAPPTRSTRWPPMPARQRRWVVAGRARATAEFSWARVAQQTLEVYRDVLARR